MALYSQPLLLSTYYITEMAISRGLRLQRFRAVFRTRNFAIAPDEFKMYKSGIIRMTTHMQRALDVKEGDFLDIFVEESANQDGTEPAIVYIKPGERGAVQDKYNQLKVFIVGTKSSPAYGFTLAAHLHFMGYPRAKQRQHGLKGKWSVETIDGESYVKLSFPSPQEEWAKAKPDL